MDHNTIVLDDGEFYIELNGNYEAAVAPGFLQRRCLQGLTTPSGFECIGSFDKSSQGKWRADVNAPYDPTSESDVLVLAMDVERMDAISVLWHGRHQALCNHRTY